MAFAWGIAWSLTALGLLFFGLEPSGNVVFSNPERAGRVARVSAVLAYGLPLAGWLLAVVMTCRHLTLSEGGDSRLVMRCAVGWALAWVAAVPLGLSWMRTWDAGFFGLIVAMGLAGAIGGTLTVPATPGSSGMPVRVLMVSSVAWGLAFLVLAFAGLFAGYFSMAFSMGGLANLTDGALGGMLAFSAPFGAAGFFAARIGQHLLGWEARRYHPGARHP